MPVIFWFAGWLVVCPHNVPRANFSLSPVDRLLIAAAAAAAAFCGTLLLLLLLLFGSFVEARFFSAVVAIVRGDVDTFPSHHHFLSTSSSSSSSSSASYLSA